MNTLELTRFPYLQYSATEAINTLCTNLMFMGEDQRRIMVTSCRGGEGKSFLSLCILRTLARLGHRAVLVDADLRKSQMAAAYGMRMSECEGYGTTHFLAGMCPLSEVVYATEIKGAYIVPVGETVSNSLALLNKPRFAQMLNALQEKYEFVIVDTPPVGLIIDAAEIARSCSGTIFAVKYNSIGRKELADAMAQIEQSGCEVLGAVLNDVDMETLSSKKYYNRYYYSRYDSDYYGSDDSPKAKRDRNDRKKR